MKNTFNAQKVFYSLFLVAALVLIVPAVNYVSVAFGWTNPPCTPPSCNGAMFVDQNTGKVSIGAVTASSTLTVNGEISAVGHKVVDVATPTAGTDAVNLDYLQAQVGGGGGGASLVLYYKTLSNVITPPATCPAGWTTKYVGYGPHYLGLLNYDWYQGGSGGTGGGFPAGGGAPPAGGSTYYLASVAIGSDSTCSQNQQSVVPFSSIYVNTIQTGFTSIPADACFTNPSTGVIECNRCVVCEK